MSPQINYIPDPADPNILYAQFDARYSAAQQYYNNKVQYGNIDKAAADLAQRNWKQWAVGAVIAKDAGQFGSYRPAPIAANGHTVTWNGSAGVIADSGHPVWSPDPTWNVNDWETSQTGTGEDLVKINDPARNLQGAGGFAGSSAGSSAPAGSITLTLEQLQKLIASIKAT